MDNERYTLENKWRRRILIADDSVHLIGLLGRTCIDANMYAPSSLKIDFKPNGARRGQRKGRYNWS